MLQNVVYGSLSVIIFLHIVLVTAIRLLQAGRAYAALLQDQPRCSDHAAAACAPHDFSRHWRRGADAGTDRYHVPCTQAQINEAALAHATWLFHCLSAAC